MAAGLLLVLGAIFSSLRQAPGPNGGPPGSPSADAGIVPELRALGPLSVGTIVDGFRVDRIESHGNEVRLQLSRDGTSVLVGLAAPRPGLPPPLLPFPDVYVWYATEGDATTPPTSLINELVRVLRAAAGQTTLHRKILEWKGDGADAAAR